MPFRRSPHAVSTQLDASASVVLHLSTQAYFRLNATAQVLWDRLDPERPLATAELVETLLAHTNGAVTRTQAEEDVEAFVDAMLDADLIAPA